MSVIYLGTQPPRDRVEEVGVHRVGKKVHGNVFLAVVLSCILLVINPRCTPRVFFRIDC